MKVIESQSITIKILWNFKAKSRVTTGSVKYKNKCTKSKQWKPRETWGIMANEQPVFQQEQVA